MEQHLLCMRIWTGSVKHLKQDKMNKTAALPIVLTNKSTKEKRQKQFEMPPPNDATWSESILAPMAVQNTRRGCVSCSEAMAEDKHATRNSKGQEVTKG